VCSDDLILIFLMRFTNLAFILTIIVPEFDLGLSSTKVKSLKIQKKSGNFYSKSHKNPEQNTHTHVVWTSNNRVISLGNVCCCLLPQCEALYICCWGFSITTKWCYDQNVNAMSGATFTKKMCSLRRPLKNVNFMKNY